MQSIAFPTGLTSLADLLGVGLLAGVPVAQVDQFIGGEENPVSGEPLSFSGPEWQEALWRTAAKLSVQSRRNPARTFEIASYLQRIQPRLTLPSETLLEELIPNQIGLRRVELHVFNNLSFDAKKGIYLLLQLGVPPLELRELFKNRDTIRSSLPEKEKGLDGIFRLAYRLHQANAVGYEYAFNRGRPDAIDQKFHSNGSQAHRIRSLFAELRQGLVFAKNIGVTRVHLARQYSIPWQLLKDSERWDIDHRLRPYLDEKFGGRNVYQYSVEADFEVTTPEGSHLVEVKSLKGVTEISPWLRAKLILQSIHYALVIRHHPHLRGVEYVLEAHNGISEKYIGELTKALEKRGVPYRITVVKNGEYATRGYFRLPFIGQPFEADIDPRGWKSREVDWSYLTPPERRFLEKMAAPYLGENIFEHPLRKIVYIEGEDRAGPHFLLANAHNLQRPLASDKIAEILFEAAQLALIVRSDESLQGSPHQSEIGGWVIGGVSIAEESNPEKTEVVETVAKAEAPVATGGERGKQETVLAPAAERMESDFRHPWTAAMVDILEEVVGEIAKQRNVREFVRVYYRRTRFQDHAQQVDRLRKIIRDKTTSLEPAVLGDVQKAFETFSAGRSHKISKHTIDQLVLIAGLMSGDIQVEKGEESSALLFQHRHEFARSVQGLIEDMQATLDLVGMESDAGEVQRAYGEMDPRQPRSILGRSLSVVELLDLLEGDVVLRGHLRQVIDRYDQQFASINRRLSEPEVAPAILEEMVELRVATPSKPRRAPIKVAADILPKPEIVAGLVEKCAGPASHAAGSPQRGYPSHQHGCHPHIFQQDPTVPVVQEASKEASIEETKLSWLRALLKKLRR